MNIRKNFGWPGLAALSLVLGLHGCGGGGEDTSSAASQITVNTPAMIAQVSADDYDANVNGLITPATLKRWKDNWPTERAKLGLTGKLVIFQVTKGDAGVEFIKPGSADVFTYLEAGWTMTRNNGVVETTTMVLDGPSMDAMLKKYNIDPRKDMIVAAMGGSSGSNAMAQGRVWYTLRYWGVDKKNLALLNGGNGYAGVGSWAGPNGMSAADFQATANTAPNSGTISIKSIPVDNTQLQATVSDMLKILPGSDVNVKNDGVFIWDARNLPNYNGTGFQNAGGRQGHPNGALLLEFSNLQDSTKGNGYKSKAELQAYLDGNISGVGFIAGDGAGGFSDVGVGNAYQEGDVVYTYCETTMRAMITGVASGVILGKPTRFYDGAMTEWNSLSYMLDKNGDYLLPWDSPWRTDKPSISFFIPASDTGKAVNPRTITNPYAASTNAIVDADKAYKTGESVSGGGGGAGGGAPSNPCGG